MEELRRDSVYSYDSEFEADEDVQVDPNHHQEQTTTKGKDKKRVLPLKSPKTCHDILPSSILERPKAAWSFLETLEQFSSAGLTTPEQASGLGEMWRQLSSSRKLPSTTARPFTAGAQRSFRIQKKKNNAVSKKRLFRDEECISIENEADTKIFMSQVQQLLSSEGCTSDDDQALENGETREVNEEKEREGEDKEEKLRKKQAQLIRMIDELRAERSNKVPSHILKFYKTEILS